MTFLVRSRAVVLLLALGALGSTEATLRRRATEDSLSFTNVDIAEAESNGSMGKAPPDFGEDAVAIPEEEEENAEFLPPLDNFDLQQQQHQNDELERIAAHEYQEAMMRAQEYENQAKHEQEIATEHLVQEATPQAQRAATLATDRASAILEEVHEVEDDLELQQQQQQQQQHEIDNLQAFAEDRRRHLLKTIQSSGKTQATLHGITYKVEE